MKKDFTVECNVCKQRYDNWSGSTPCCGSIAFLVNEDDTVSSKISIFSNLGEVEIDLKCED